MKICVVGGGTAGFVSALILKTTFPTAQVDVIRSKNIGTIGVGEGSTEHFTSFIEYVGIDPFELIKETNATFKSGIMFKDWTKEPYLHNVEGALVAEHMHTPFIYSKLISEDVGPKNIVSKLFWDSELPMQNFLDKDRPEQSLFSQYHFNTNKLGEFLTKKSIEKGCNVFDDEITDVVVSDWHGIDHIRSKKEKYKYDFYIDCTGFARLLISKLGAEWKSYSQYLKMKEAIVFPTPEMDEIPVWTLAKAMNAGWMFRIPTQGRTGNGYIFDSDYIDAEQAQKEVEAYLGEEINVAKNIKFDPGALDKPWIDNVCAVGLSANFVEPLEASSIGTSINQMFLLASRLVNYNQHTINRYNEEVNSIMDNIRDFIILHYITDRQDTPFWKERYISKNTLPDSLKQNLEMWKDRLPIKGDFVTKTDKVLFAEYNYIVCMYGLGLFNIENIKKQYEMFPTDAKNYAEQAWQNKLDAEKVHTLPQKMMLEIIRRIR